MLVTPDGEIAARLRRLREHGMDVSAAERHHIQQPVVEHYTEVGFNYRMTDVQAAIGLVQLAKLGPLVARRRDLARRYHRLLSTVPGLTDRPGPALWRDELPVFLGTATRRRPGVTRRPPASARRCGHLRTARHHGRSYGARIREKPAQGIARYGTPDQAVSHPPTLPRHDRRTAGTYSISSDRRSAASRAHGPYLMTPDLVSIITCCWSKDVT